MVVGVRASCGAPPPLQEGGPRAGFYKYGSSGVKIGLTTAFAPERYCGASVPPRRSLFLKDVRPLMLGPLHQLRAGLDVSESWPPAKCDVVPRFTHSLVLSDSLSRVQGGGLWSWSVVILSQGKLQKALPLRVGS
jgi:hypothetical protein